MGERVIESKDDMAKAFNETDEAIDSLKAETDAANEKLAAIAAEQEEKAPLLVDLQTTVEDIKTRFESLYLAKSTNDWKEQDTPEAKAYGLAKIVQAMMEGTMRRSPTAVATLAKYGALGVKDRADTNGWANADEEYKGREKSITDTKAGLSSSPMTGDDSVGSYLGSYVIPVEYRAELERIALDNSAMMSLVRRVTVPGITSYLPYTTDELAFTKLTNQNTDKTEDNLTLARRTLTTEIYAAYVAIVEEFFEDSLVEIGGVIRDMFGEAWGKKFDSLCLEDSTYGAVATADNTVTMSTGDSNFDSVEIEDLVDMKQQLDTRAKRNGAMYFMHPEVWDFIEEQLDAQGRYQFGTVNEVAPLRVRSKPVVLTDGMPDNSNDDAVSTRFVGFGNPRYIWNGQRVGFEFRIFDQTQSAMESGQIFLRVRTRQAFVTSMQNAWVALLTAGS
jgi:HK97 family phage major capsid protein